MPGIFFAGGKIEYASEIAEILFEASDTLTKEDFELLIRLVRDELDGYADGNYK